MAESTFFSDAKVLDAFYELLRGATDEVANILLRILLRLRSEVAQQILEELQAV
ncbi:MAG: hypothetical protein Q7S63_02515 [bacterium]|nr:hypothetical protein [bacterium]